MSDSPPLSRPDSLPRWFDQLIASVRATDGQPPFSDQAIVDARRGERQVLTTGDFGLALVARLATGNEAEFVVAPDARGHGHGTALLEALVAESPDGLLLWAHGDHPAARALAARFGFDAVRTLLQLRAEVAPFDTALARPPRTAPSTSPGSAAGLDAFIPGTDDAEWLALNARAFASHPEQGSVSQADLDELRREPWYRDDDFLVVREDGRMVGYCWLKIEDAVGEFYVVGVDPDRQGAGLGRRLVAAGLARLAERGIRTASLYVEADNTPALALYRSFGFSEFSIDIQYALRRFH